MCREPTNLSNSSWLILSCIFLLPLCPVTALNCHCSDSIIQEAGGNCWQPANCTWASAHPQEAEKVEHGTADTSLHLLCLASSPLFFPPPSGTGWQKIQGSKREWKWPGKMLCPREGLDKGHYLFFFFPALSQQPGMQWPCFPVALVIHLLSTAWLSCHSAGSELLEAPGSSFALAQALTGSDGDELLSWEHSSVWSFTENSFSLSLQTFACHFTSTINSRRLFWNLSPSELLLDMTELPGLPAPVSPVFQGWVALADCRSLHSSFPHSMQAHCVCLVPGLSASTYALWPGPNIAGFWGESWEN